MSRRRRTRAEMMALVAAWDLVPLDLYPGAHERWRNWCRRCENVVYPTYAVMSMERTKNACRECDKLHKRNLFLAPHDEMVQVFMEHGFAPLGRYPGSNKPWPSVHLACNSFCAPYLANVKSRGGGCEQCARATRGSKRRVDALVAGAVMRAAGLVPLAGYPTSGEPWECLCTSCEQVVSPTYDNVRAGNGGCRHCAAYGLGWDDPAMIYLMVHPGHLSLKVGVAKAVPARQTVAREWLLAKKYGWEPYRHIYVETGREAFTVEQEVLRWWRSDLRLPPHLTRAETEGHSETVSLEGIAAPRAWERIELVHRGLATRCLEVAS